MNTTKEIRNTLLDYYEAFHNKNWNKIAGYLTDNFRYFTDKTIIMNKDKFIDFLSKDTWQGKSYNVSEIEINIAGSGELAWGTYKTSFTGRDNNTEYTVTALETGIFVNQNGNRMIAHHHTSNKI